MGGSWSTLDIGLGYDFWSRVFFIDSRSSAQQHFFICAESGMDDEGQGCCRESLWVQSKGCGRKRAQGQQRQQLQAMAQLSATSVSSKASPQDFQGQQFGLPQLRVLSFLPSSRLSLLFFSPRSVRVCKTPLQMRSSVESMPSKMPGPSSLTWRRPCSRPERI